MVIALVFILIIYFIPDYGQTNVMVYISVCSLVGSLSVSFSIVFSFFILSFFPFYRKLAILLCLPVVKRTLLNYFWQVMSVKALGIALKLTFSGMNQLIYPQTWAFTLVVLTCVITQMNYLNKVINIRGTSMIIWIYCIICDHFSSKSFLYCFVCYKFTSHGMHMLICHIMLLVLRIDVVS